MSTDRELKNARNMASAQARYDASEPRSFWEDDDDGITEVELLTQAPKYVPLDQRQAWMAGYLHPKDTPEDWEDPTRSRFGDAFYSGVCRRLEDEQEPT